MCNVAHFFGEDVADIVLAFDVKNFNGLVLNPFAHRVLSELDVTHGFQCHVVGPENTGTVVVEHFGGPGDVTGTVTPQALKPRVKFRAATVSLLPMFVAFISASHELRDVRCCRSVFQDIGPLMRRMMAPLMLRNLNSGVGVPLRTAFPS